MHAAPTPLRTLLYRYFFYGWLFRDATRGNAWERSSAWRHNREQARWLPTYMKRWSVLGSALFLAGLGVEAGWSAPLLSAAIYLPAVLALPFTAVTAVGWLFLTRRTA